MSGTSDGNEDFEEQLRLQQLYGDGQGDQQHTFEDPSDGTIYEWDPVRNGWFPKITEDFLAMYHASYGVPAEDVTTVPEPPPQTENKPAEPPKTTPEGQPPRDTNLTEGEQKPQKPKAEKRKADPGWFDVEETRNTNVYVTGLPPDITDDEFIELMSKYGIIMRDLQTEDYKVKLYKDHQGNLKGDGLCCYLKKESVDLALKLLDEYEIRGYKLHVEAAKFELKGEYDAKKKRKRGKDYRKKLSIQQKLLDWRPEKKPGETRLRCDRVIIIQNMFHPKDFEEDPLVLNEIREDLRTECEKFGQVKKVLIFDRHPDGIASVSFKETEEADMCIAALNGRWFGGRQLSVETWDGVTDYQIDETSREREERLKGWDSFLGDANKKDDAAVPDSPKAAVPDSPKAAVPEAPAATVPESPAATVPESPAATVPESPAATVPDSSASATEEIPVGKQHGVVEPKTGDVTNVENVQENNGEHNNEDDAQSTDSSLGLSDDEEEKKHV